MNVRIGATVALPHSPLPFIRKAERANTIVVWNHAEQTSFVVKAYTVVDGQIHLPRQYGLDMALTNGLSIEYDLADGEVLPDLPEIALKDYQEPWVNEVVRQFDNQYDVVATAATGKGKTVMALEVARRLGATFLVIVDQEFLRDQWIERAGQFLGLHPDEIGIIQGGRCDYEGKVMTVAMIQSLYNREYHEDLYYYFGTVIFDEVHTAGAEQFSNALGQFPARHRLGVTATLRTDALQSLLDLNLGKPKVALSAEHARSLVRFLTYKGVLSWYANISPKSGRFISEIASDNVRNFLLAEAIKRLYDTNRDILAVSDRIEHLENLLAICVELGIPREDMGIISGYYMKWGYVKDATPPRKPVGLHPGAAYTPVRLKLTSRRMPRPMMDRVKNNARVVFATYGMFQKGVDVPRLAAGIDCTPRAKAEQVHGRILRSLDGKLIPIWVTVRDLYSYKAEYQFAKRLEEYRKSNAEIEQWDFNKGVKRHEAPKLLAEVRRRTEELKARRIQTEPDGNNTVRTSSLGKG